jgi:Ca-activated chloride channel family protein
MKIIAFWGVLCTMVPLVASFSTEWDYSHAIRSAQNEQWPDAQQLMSTLMINDPDNAELLYDSGVAAYRMKEYSKAEAYFHQTTENEQANDLMKQKAFFNVGNTQVALNRLEEAIASYGAALTIDPEDERAQHNLKKVRELLEQQKQQEQQQQKKNQKNEKQQNQQQDQSKQDTKQQQQASQDDQSGQQDSNEQSGDQQKKRKKQRQQQDAKQQGESTDDERQEQDADEQQEGKNKDNANDKSNDNSRDQEQEQFSDTHDSSPQKNSAHDEQQKTRDADVHHTKQGDKSQEMQGGELNEQEGIEDTQAKQQKKLEEGLAPQDRWMVRVLQQREQADEKANKRIVKAMIDKELAGKDGQNCW